MFSSACARILGSIYLVIGRSQGETVSGGTAFMVAPGILATAAHITYKHARNSASYQDRIWVMQAPEIGQNKEMEIATVIAVDSAYDIGLLKIENPRRETSVKLITQPLSVGIDVGTIGFPLLNTKMIIAGSEAPILRFQGGHLSASYSKTDPQFGRTFVYHETDVPMYKGSSGCPGFLIDGKVFGMHVFEWHEEDDEGKPKQRAFSGWVPASAIISLAEREKIAIAC